MEMEISNSNNLDIPRPELSRASPSDRREAATVSEPKDGSLNATTTQVRSVDNVNNDLNSIKSSSVDRTKSTSPDVKASERNAASSSPSRPGSQGFLSTVKLSPPKERPAGSVSPRPTPTVVKNDTESVEKSQETGESTTATTVSPVKNFDEAKDSEGTTETNVMDVDTATTVKDAEETQVKNAEETGEDAEMKTDTEVKDAVEGEAVVGKQPKRGKKKGRGKAPKGEGVVKKAPTGPRGPRKPKSAASTSGEPPRRSTRVVPTPPKPKPAAAAKKPAAAKKAPAPAKTPAAPAKAVAKRTASPAAAKKASPAKKSAPKEKGNQKGKPPAKAPAKKKPNAAKKPAPAKGTRPIPARAARR